MKDLLKNWQIFIIDDNEDDLIFLSRKLSEAGFSNFKAFTNVDEFLNNLHYSVVVVIIDHKLSHLMSGVDVMKEAVSRVPLCFPIILSGNEDPQVIKNYLNNDAFRYVVKKGDEYFNEVIIYINDAHNKMEALAKHLYG